MNKDVILDTGSMLFKYKSYRFESYKLIYDKNEEPFVVGEGRFITSFNEPYINANGDKIVASILKFNKYIKKGEIAESLITFKDLQKKIEGKYGSQEKNDLHKRMMITRLSNIASYLCSLKGDNTIDFMKKFNENYVYLVNGIFEILEKYGFPEDLLVNNKEQKYKVNVNDFILKLLDLYKFREDIESSEHYIETTEIGTAKYGLKRGKYDEPILVTYFTCPFEYLKFKIIISKLTDYKRIGSCEYCSSLFIAQKSNRRFCDNSCRASGSRLRKKQRQ